MSNVSVTFWMHIDSAKAVRTCGSARRGHAVEWLKRRSGARTQRPPHNGPHLRRSLVPHPKASLEVRGVHQQRRWVPQTKHSANSRGFRPHGCFDKPDAKTGTNTQLRGKRSRMRAGGSLPQPWVQSELESGSSCCRTVRRRCFGKTSKSPGIIDSPGITNLTGVESPVFPKIEKLNFFGKKLTVVTAFFGAFDRYISIGRRTRFCER
jgi:hypothetical protein